MVLYAVRPSRKEAVDDVELELDRHAVVKNARDPSIVFVSQDDRRHRLFARS